MRTYSDGHLTPVKESTLGDEAALVSQPTTVMKFFICLSKVLLISKRNGYFCSLRRFQRIDIYAKLYQEEVLPNLDDNCEFFPLKGKLRKTAV